MFNILNKLVGNMCRWQYNKKVADNIIISCFFVLINSVWDLAF